MSVFTEVTPADLDPWLNQHSVGQMHALHPIAAGVENTNYFLDTTSGRYVLTLFERVDPQALPFYLSLLHTLAAQNVPCPDPIPDQQGRLHSQLCGKPAAIVTRLAGEPVEHPLTSHCHTIGHWLARMHLASAGTSGAVPNPRGNTWRRETAQAIRPFLTAEQLALLTQALKLPWPEPGAPDALPGGVIHADLFRDNALWTNPEQAELSGVIDFYFAGEDAWLFDLAVTVNDWCLATDGVQLDADKTQALLRSYHAIRPLGNAEHSAWPAALSIAALRFWLSRLADMHLPRPGEVVQVKAPLAYQRILANRLSCLSDRPPPWVF